MVAGLLGASAVVLALAGLAADGVSGALLAISVSVATGCGVTSDKVVLGVGVGVKMSAGVASGAALLLSGSCREVMLAVVGVSDPAGAVARTSAAAASAEVDGGTVAVLGSAWAAVAEGAGVGLRRTAGRSEAGGRA